MCSGAQPKPLCVYPPLLHLYAHRIVHLYRNGPYVHHSVYKAWGIPEKKRREEEEEKKGIWKEIERSRDRWVDFLWSGGRSLNGSTFRGSPGHTRSCRPFEETSTNCLSGPYLTVYSAPPETIGYPLPISWLNQTAFFDHFPIHL